MQAFPQQSACLKLYKYYKSFKNFFPFIFFMLRSLSGN